MTERVLEELTAAGLLDPMPQPHLTAKGRAWLRALEDLTTQEVVDLGEEQIDLIQSTSGIFR